MPKLSHEALVHLVRAAPEVIVGLLQRELGLELPAMAHPRITAAELVDLNLAEYRADAVITLGPDAAPTEAFVFEAQNDVDLRKRRTWPLYVAGLRARLNCPVTLVIIALDPRVAAWCAEPIDLGRQRGTIHPLVLGPAQIPVITDPAEACRAPELADDIIELRVPGDVVPDLAGAPVYLLDIVLRGTATKLGQILLRLDHEDRGLVDYAGHIGFEIAAEHRGHRYALRATRLLSPLARRHGFSELWLTTSPDNLASRHTLELLGAQYVDTVPIPPASDMHALGIHQVCRYRWALTTR